MGTLTDSNINPQNKNCRDNKSYSQEDRVIDFWIPGETSSNRAFLSNFVTWLLHYRVHRQGGDTKGLAFSADNLLSTVKNKEKELSAMLF